MFTRIPAATDEKLLGNGYRQRRRWVPTQHMYVPVCRLCGYVAAASYGPDFSDYLTLSISDVYAILFCKV